jgi:hypothetical protein
MATLRQLNAGVSIAAVARSCEIDSPMILIRERQLAFSAGAPRGPASTLVRETYRSFQIQQGGRLPAEPDTQR